jgi:hypothetical protein
MERVEGGRNIRERATRVAARFAEEDERTAGVENGDGD